MSYATIQAIREGAGLLSRVHNETATGVADGTNKAFTVKRRPIVDSNYDDAVTKDDIQVFVNNAPVVIESMDPAEGSFSLVTAPANGTKVTVDYCFSSITDDYVLGKQQEADSWVNLKLRGIIETQLNPTPGIIATVAEMYAAGLILTRDWGNRADTELSSKDGYQKLKTARELLADYIAGIEADKQHTNASGVGDSAVLTDADPFSRTITEVCDPLDTTNDDYFMNRKC